jgi:excisionase family DNA binding protein
MPEKAPATPDEWVGTTYAAKRLGVSGVTILRRIWDGDVPSMRAGRAHRIPARLVEDAYQAVMGNGGQVILADFCRQWTAAQQVTAASAVPAEVAA